MNRIGRADGGEARGGSSGAEAVVQHPAGRWRHDGRYDGDDNEERCFWRPTWWEMEEPPLERTTWRLSFDFYTDDSFVNRSCRSDCNCGSISSPLSIIQLLFNKICLSLSLSLSFSFVSLVQALPLPAPSVERLQSSPGIFKNPGLNVAIQIQFPATGTRLPDGRF